MYRIASFSLLALMISQAPSLMGTPQVSRASNKDKRVEPAASRPDLAVPFESVAKVKLASRKSVFHLGEMITLDIAMLNAWEEPLFFKDISDLLMKAKTPAGDPVMIQTYGTVCRTTVPSSFNLVPHNEFLDRSFQLMARCDQRPFDHMRSADESSLTAFNEDWFLSWGDACLRAQPGTYIFEVEIRNNYVLAAPRLGKIQTAVGKIKSNPLEISIVD
jgi:hypothetical protein